MASSAVSGLDLMHARKPHSAVVNSKDAIRDVCIEWNGNMFIEDFVPALQDALLRHGVQSRVMDAGAASTGCSVTISYEGYVKWDTRMWSDKYSAYLAYAVLTLRRDGRMLATAQYMAATSGSDKWDSSSDKLAPLVSAILPGNPEVDDKAPPGH